MIKQLTRCKKESVGETINTDRASEVSKILLSSEHLRRLFCSNQRAEEGRSGKKNRKYFNATKISI